MRNALQGQPGMSVHLSIDGRWQHNFALGPAEGHEIKTESNGVVILLDVGSAQKARGLEVRVSRGLPSAPFISCVIFSPHAPYSVCARNTQGTTREGQMGLRRLTGSARVSSFNTRTEPMLRRGPARRVSCLPTKQFGNVSVL